MQKRLSLTLAAVVLCAGAAYGTGAAAQTGAAAGTGTTGGASAQSQMNSDQRGAAANGAPGSGMSTSPSTGASSGSSPGTMGSSNTGRTLTMAQAEQAGLTSAQFSALDTNHDGVLDEQELAKGGYRFRSSGG